MERPRLSVAKNVDIPKEFQFCPSWRDSGDCGPIALYVLMKLEGEDVTVKQIKNEVPVDPTVGSTLESLHNASNRMGFPTEMRFVSPRDVRNLQPPFILHSVDSMEKNFGHFSVVIGFDFAKKTIKTVNLEEEVLSEHPMEPFLSGASGYILVPKHFWSETFDRAVGPFLIVFGVVALWMVGVRRHRGT